jgi:large conductance mechanosensitive channel
MNKQLKGFMDFVRTQGVVGLAVGLAIGTQVGKVVESIVEGFINPIVGFIVGSQDGLKALTWDVVGSGKTAWFDSSDRTLSIAIGDVLSALIVLFAVAGVIYYVVHGLKLDKADKKSEK